MTELFNLGISNSEMITKIIQFSSAVFIFFLGYWVAKLVSRRVSTVVGKHLSKHKGALCQKIIFYGLMLIFIVASLQQLGFKLGVLLGAAGVFTVGIGFAAQTSVANLISGIFLLIEQPFKMGDFITAKGFSGEVDSIGLLSTQLCTENNTLVRIPNASMMQAEIVNFSYFPKRRVDLVVGVAYGTDIEKARTVLLKVAKKNKLAIFDPEPQVIIADFGASSIDIKLMVWTVTESAYNLKNILKDEIYAAFDKEGIEIPFPQLTIHSQNSEK